MNIFKKKVKIRSNVNNRVDLKCKYLNISECKLISEMFYEVMSLFYFI